MAATSADDRFSMASWSAADRKGKRRARDDDNDDDAGSASRSDDGSTDGSEEEEEEDSVDDAGERGGDGLEGPDEAVPSGSGKVLAPLSKSELESFARKQKKKGVIYISRIPPGMTVPKVKHLLENFGRVERIFLQDGKQKKAGPPTKKRKKHTSANFSEGWAEFSSKSVAKAVAEMLNAQTIGAAAVTKSGMKAAKHQPGGMKGNARRFKDDVWTMKYLPGFKWHMLTEQLANERASRTSRLRTELSQSAFEQKDYLRKAERARIMNEKEAKRARRQEQEGDGVADAAQAPGEAARDGKRIRTFQQRAPVVSDVRDIARDKERSSKRQRTSAEESSAGKPRSAALDSVLSSIF